MYKLLSFLGTTRYEKAYYNYDNIKSKRPYQFVQEALLEFFHEKLKNGQVIVFLTEKSKKKNWLGKSESKNANFKNGLKNRLSDVKRELKVNLEVKEVKISEGRSERELWDIFEKMNEIIDKKDTIILDITHSFRSLPLLTLIVLNYVKFLKGVKIERIVYGAMEALGSPEEIKNMPLEEREIPLFDLTPFARLFDWTVAIERFLETGSAEMIKRVGIEELKPLLAETRGKKGGKIRNLINLLDKFSENVSTCRAPEFKENIRNILETIPDAEKELEKLKPFKPLFTKIKERFSMKVEDDVTSGLKTASWCLEKGLIQQGFTILRETIINYIIKNFLNSNDLKSESNREKAEKMLNTSPEKVPKEILDLWNGIRDYRNDINHAGWRETNYHRSDKFKKKLKEFIKMANDVL
ncbi:MAG: TIGR02221 family CRISPR-associated protein [Methanothermobacter tenebrarum]|nr:TIGR02221 family CRISPR-associated protein [Methanobacteriaceae archaeon]